MDNVTPVRWRPKPIDIEAIRYDGTNADTIRAWQRPHQQPTGHPTEWFYAAAEAPVVTPAGADAVVYDYLHHTWVGLTIGAWIIHGPRDEFYPIVNDVLHLTYDRCDTQERTDSA